MIMLKVRRWVNRKRKVVWTEPALPKFVKINPGSPPGAAEGLQPGDITMARRRRRVPRDARQRGARVTGAGPGLVLGPLLRYAGETAATIWVETDRACEVEVLGRRARTFHVAGHHYALVVVDGLAPGTGYEYQVTLDGAVRWPEPRLPVPA